MSTTYPNFKKIGHKKGSWDLVGLKCSVLRGHVIHRHIKQLWEPKICHISKILLWIAMPTKNKLFVILQINVTGIERKLWTGNILSLTYGVAGPPIVEENPGPLLILCETFSIQTGGFSFGKERALLLSWTLGFLFSLSYLSHYVSLRHTREGIQKN